MPASIFQMPTTTPIEYPNGQFHYCFETHSISIKGDDGIVYPRDSGKSQYGSTEIANTCFHLHDYYNSTATHLCGIEDIQNKEYVLLYKNGGCSVGIHFKETNKNRDKDTEILSISNRLSQQLISVSSSDKYKHAYFVDVKHIIIDYPLGTSHFCNNNNHIALTGYDNIVYGNRIGSKSAYSFSNIDDSCYHSLMYFSKYSTHTCNMNELTLHPLRTYGHCFISSNYVNHSMTIDYRDYLLDVGCHGCEYGQFYHIENSAINIVLQYNILIIHIILFVYLII